MVQERYEVRLVEQDRRRLRKIIRSGRSSAQAITRARILLKIDEGWTAPQVAAALDISERTVFCTKFLSLAISGARTLAGDIRAGADVGAIESAVTVKGALAVVSPTFTKTA